MYYSSVGQFGVYGSWGALEFHNQDTSTAPKYLALMKFIKCSSIITGRNEDSENTARFTVFPNPSNGNNLNIKLKEPLDHSGQIQIRITDLLGRPMYENSNLKGNDISIENLSLNKGLYMIFIQTGASRHYSELLVN